MTDPNPLADWTLERNALTSKYPHRLETPSDSLWLNDYEADQFEQAKAICEQHATGPLPADPPRFTAEVDAEFAQTTDAQRWAAEFQRIFRDLNHRTADLWASPVDDLGWLIGWFANAIERGRTAGAAPFGGEGSIMCGHAISRALAEGRKIQIRFLTDGDISWEDADRRTDDHPEGIPADWYGEAFGQIDLVVRDVTDAPEFAHVNAPRFPQPPADDLPPGVHASPDGRLWWTFGHGWPKGWERRAERGWTPMAPNTPKAGRAIEVRRIQPPATVKVRLHQLAGRRLPGCDWAVQGDTRYSSGNRRAFGPGGKCANFTVDADGYVDVQPEPTDADA